MQTKPLPSRTPPNCRCYVTCEFVLELHYRKYLYGFCGAMISSTVCGLRPMRKLTMIPFGSKTSFRRCITSTASFGCEYPIYGAFITPRPCSAEIEPCRSAALNFSDCRHRLSRRSLTDPLVDPGLERFLDVLVPLLRDDIDMDVRVSNMTVSDRKLDLIL